MDNRKKGMRSDRERKMKGCREKLGHRQAKHPPPKKERVH
jgi:hypothetical protein